MKKSYFLFVCACALLIGCKHNTSPVIAINQVGFSPMQEKTATIALDGLEQTTNDQQPTTRVFILNENQDTVWQGTASPTMLNPVSGKPRQLVDFSDLKECGEYTLCVTIPSLSSLASAHFIINERPYRELTRAALRAYYHQRASMATEEPYAEGYARPAGHPDDHVLVHASAATDTRPEGTVISSPGGWYDAGDYNKYIVNSGYTMGVWLMAYEMNKAYFDTLHLNIPESPIPCPDMLAEAMYNIRWMLTMQDTDGGVYHKLTEPDFEGFIRPDECRKTRYVVLKTTAAALDFAATMALAARVYAPFEAAYPGFVAEATEAAKRAYQWAEDNPIVYYDQPKMNEHFSPAITTGAYDDNCVVDEFYWAATELYLLTHDNVYKKKALNTCPEEYTPAVWGDVAELASLEWMMHRDEQFDFALECQDALFSHLLPYIEEGETVSVYRSPYGNRENDFFWGCNSEGCCWRGVECLYAYRLTGDEKYRINAERCLNYVLGQNATGYCYVTGFGDKSPMHPHHRISEADNVEAPFPGMLVGGPNPGQQDKRDMKTAVYPSNHPDESYIDNMESYASNEIAINWNASLVAFLCTLDALKM